jgi:tRNA(Arg) A34 adenosine deaminase TadA
MKKYSDTELIRKTVEIANFNASSGFGGGPFGALIVKEGEIISSCGNSVTVNNDPTAHAEVNAIREACSKLKTFDLSGATLYTSCEPCPMCLAAAYWARVDKICFAADRHDAAEAGFSDAFIYNEFTVPLEQRSIPIEQIDTDDKVLPFSTWKENEKKTLY